MTTNISKPALSDLVRTIPDYPKPGIMFRDVTTLLAHPYGLRAAVDALVWPYLLQEIDVVVGIEARGFILGGAVAHQLGKGFVPIRKKGKLPAQTVGQDYSLEYGVDRIEMHSDAVAPGQRVLIVDDLIATGGTALAAVALVEAVGGVAAGTAFIIDLPDLGGSRRIHDRGIGVHTLMEFEGD